jgi:hypothetical protein
MYSLSKYLRERGDTNVRTVEDLISKAKFFKVCNYGYSAATESEPGCVVVLVAVELPLNCVCVLCALCVLCVRARVAVGCCYCRTRATTTRSAASSPDWRAR